MSWFFSSSSIITIEMFKGAFIHHIAIDPKLSIYIIEVVYGLFVWIHECPIATYKGDGFGWLYMELYARVCQKKNI